MSQINFESLSAIAMANDNKGVMDNTVRRLWPGQKVCGRAVTVELEPEVGCLTEEIIGTLQPGDVLVVANRGFECAFLDEKAQCLLKKQGVAALVTDAVVRNAANWKGLDLPVFAKGVCDKLQTGKQAAIAGEPIVCGGVLVYAEDQIFADEDGVVVVRKENLERVLKKAQETEKKRLC